MVGLLLIGMAPHDEVQHRSHVGQQFAGLVALHTHHITQSTLRLTFLLFSSVFPENSWDHSATETFMYVAL